MKLIVLLLIMFSLAVKFMTDVVLAAATACVVVFVLSLLYAVKVLWFDPWKIRRMLRMQGIKGPKPSFVYGNVWEMRRIEAASSAVKTSSGAADQNGEFVAHDYTSTLFPYFEQWRKEYGPIYTYSTGRKQHLYVNQPELVRELWRCTSCEVGKPLYVTKKLAPLLGNGILRSNGHMWSQQRKLLAPQFSMDKLKGTVGLMVECAESLTKKWEEHNDVQGGKSSDIRVEEDLRSFSADVISISFGSSYLKAKAVCSKLRTLQKLISKQSFLFGSHAFGLFPTRNQKEINKLEKEIESLIWEAVKEREAKGNAENKDLLLQLILEEATAKSSKSFVVDNFKNIYFAGHESTAVAASWCLMLLALHPQWQEEIRDEVDRTCNENGGLNADSLHRLKTVTMVIQEVLRLYPPAAFVSREALKETKLGHVTVPKGVCVWTLIPTLHRDVGVWGPDVNEFNPRRFVDAAPHQVYIPFGLGPRLCLGRNFAMSQLKVLVAVIVSKFRFGLSPEYRHSPAYRMIVEPGQGVCLVLRRR